MDVDGQRFRVRPPQFSTPWLPETPSHRHLPLVWFRLLGDAHGTPLFTLQELAVIVGRAHRQAASQHLEDVRPCGEDVRACVRRQRTGEAAVVEGVWHELLHAPVAGPTEVLARVHRRWGRQDLRVAHLASALEQIAGVPVLRVRRRQ